METLLDKYAAEGLGAIEETQILSITPFTQLGMPVELIGASGGITQNQKLSTNSNMRSTARDSQGKQLCECQHSSAPGLIFSFEGDPNLDSNAAIPHTVGSSASVRYAVVGKSDAIPTTLTVFFRVSNRVWQPLWWCNIRKMSVLQIPGGQPNRINNLKIFLHDRSFCAKLLI